MLFCFYSCNCNCSLCGRIFDAMHQSVRGAVRARLPGRLSGWTPHAIVPLTAYSYSYSYLYLLWADRHGRASPRRGRYPSKYCNTSVYFIFPPAYCCSFVYLYPNSRSACVCSSCNRTVASRQSRGVPLALCPLASALRLSGAWHRVASLRVTLLLHRLHMCAPLLCVRSFLGSRAILSGPAGGVVGYARSAHLRFTKQPLIGFDMGGIVYTTEQSSRLSIREHSIKEHSR